MCLGTWCGAGVMLRRAEVVLRARPGGESDGFQKLLWMIGDSLHRAGTHPAVMCVCVCACLYVCMSVCVWCLCVRVCMCMSVCVWVYPHVCVHACPCIWVYMCTTHPLGNNLAVRVTRLDTNLRVQKTQEFFLVNKSSYACHINIHINRLDTNFHVQRTQNMYLITTFS